MHDDSLSFAVVRLVCLVCPYDRAPPLCEVRRRQARDETKVDLLVRMFIVLTAMALLLISDQADAGKLKDPGQGHLQYKAPKTGPDYYIVRQSDSDKCSIVPGRFGQKPVGTVGNAPYANRAYANAALRLAPECKGGLLDEGH